MTGDINFYWRILLRRLPVMAALFLCLASAGVAIAIKLPTSYSSTAELLVESPKIPTDLAASTVQTDPTEELELIRQRLMTRSNLLDIANEFRVFQDMRSMSPDEIVQEMRGATQIVSRTISGRRNSGGPARLTVSFSARNGKIASAVVNEYTTRIVDASVRQRTGVAEDTLEFFEQEVERLDEELAERSARLSEFQSANSESLPESLTYRMGRQSLLLERLADIGRERAALTDQRKRFVSIYEATGQLDPSATQDPATLSPAARELQQVRSDLSQALSVYSESHPRVQSLRNRVSQLQNSVASETPSEAGDGTAPANTAESMLDLQLSEIDRSLEALDTEEARAEAELQELEETIQETPANGIRLASMQRDYESVRQQYDAAVRDLAQARVGERIELTSRGQRISLIEAGTVPNEPSSPNRPKIAATGIAAGGALAIAYFFLLEILNRTIRRPAEMEKRLGLTPLGVIPYLETARHRRLRRTARIAALIVVIIGVPTGFWAIDTYYMPLDLLFERVLDRFGIT